MRNGKHEDTADFLMQTVEILLKNGQDSLFPSLLERSSI